MISWSGLTKAIENARVAANESVDDAKDCGSPCNNSKNTVQNGENDGKRQAHTISPDAKITVEITQENELKHRY